MRAGRSRGHYVPAKGQRPKAEVKPLAIYNRPTVSLAAGTRFGGYAFFLSILLATTLWTSTSLEDLARPARANGMMFIGSNLGTNGIIRGGYKLTVVKNAAPDVTDVGADAAACNGSVRPPASSFFASAEPVTAGRAPYFAADARAIIFSSAKPISNPIVESATVERLR